MKRKIFGLACLFSAQFLAAMNIVDITGLDKKIILKALHESAQLQGISWFNWEVNDSLSDTEVSKFLQNNFVDYFLRGRKVNVDLSGNTINTTLYNQYNGENAAEKVIAKLRKT